MKKKFDLTEKLGPYKESALYGIILTGIILIFIIIIILPYNHSVSKMDDEIKTIKNQLAAQELQAPLYTSLKMQLEKNKIEGLNLSDDEKLNRNHIFQISSILKGLAEKNNLVYTKSDPDINSMENNNGFLSVDLIIEGALNDFRNFIVSLNEIPYLQDIEHLTISAVNKNRIFKLQIWLAIE